MRKRSYPVIDLFAGPGGLGEGFSSVQRSRVPRFKSLVAIEQDEYAHKTLHLRHFIREFPSGRIPEEYYSYLAGELTRDELQAIFPEQWRAAEGSALKLSLGNENHDFVKKLVTKRLRGHKKWVLVGGPPCQAYSLVGRSRRANDPEFENDNKHFLYREYLKIIIDHQPPVFVMENVKGLLSAKVAGMPVIEKILTDLARPKAAISNRRNGLRYRLFSLSEKGEYSEGASRTSFIVRAENHGVPQARHRMFILGIRSDINIEPESLKKQVSNSVEEIIGDLPPIRSGVSKEEDSFDSWSGIVSGVRDRRWFKDAFKYRSIAGKKHLPTSRYSDVPTSPNAMNNWFTDKRLRAITGHEARSHMRLDLQRYLFSALYAKASGASPRLADFPRELLPKHRNVKAGTAGKNVLRPLPSAVVRSCLHDGDVSHFKRRPLFYPL